MRIILAFLFATALSAATSVPTGHNNNARTAANTTETVLTTTNVNSATFGLLGSFASDGKIWGQPLIASNVAGINLMIFATQHNTIYAYNADLPGSAPVWSTNFGATGTIVNPNLGNGELGCVGAPVIDEPNSKVYVVCGGPGNGSSATYVLRQLSLTTGAVLLSVTVTGEVTGTGDTGAIDLTNAANVVFYPAQQMQRPALLLANSKVYVAFGSYDDTRPWHGWIMSYNIADLSQANVFCSTPNSFGGAFWHAGGGLSADASGNIYGITSNGASTTGTGDLSQRYIKLDASLGWLASLFDPHAAENDAADKDFGSGRALLLPGGAGVVSAGKDSRLYQTDTSMVFLTGFTLVNGGSAHFGGQTYINGAEYISLSGGPINRSALSGGLLSGSVTATSLSFGYPGAQLSSTSNGAANTILWAQGRPVVGTAQPAALLAYNASTLALLYQSATISGTASKFAAPTVANGKVYLSTLSGGVAVFGLLPQPSSVITGTTVFSGKVSQ